MLWYGSYLVQWHLIGRWNLSQVAGHRKTLCGRSVELIDRGCRLREMIDWLRLVRWQTMQRLAHQGAALSVTITPDCLCSLLPPLFSSTPLVHLSIWEYKYSCLCTLAKARTHTQTNAYKQSTQKYKSLKVWELTQTVVDPDKNKKALLFFSTHLHVCSYQFTVSRHTMLEQSSQWPWASRAYYSYYCPFSKISRQDIPLRLIRLSISTSNT